MEDELQKSLQLEVNAEVAQNQPAINNEDELQKSLQLEVNAEVAQNQPAINNQGNDTVVDPSSLLNNDHRQYTFPEYVAIVYTTAQHIKRAMVIEGAKYRMTGFIKEGSLVMDGFLIEDDFKPVQVIYKRDAVRNIAEQFITLETYESIVTSSVHKYQTKNQGNLITTYKVVTIAELEELKLKLPAEKKSSVSVILSEIDGKPEIVVRPDSEKCIFWLMRSPDAVVKTIIQKLILKNFAINIILINCEDNEQIIRMSIIKELRVKLRHVATPPPP